jgi:glycerol-3-phosphate dehydrogenase
MTETLQCDVLVIGGGINGTGIARDAAGRGLRVILCEKDDLAAHTSSASSKLIHGGLRYLEYFDFDLVRKALLEREVLMRSAPHLITPLGFVMPRVPALRPAWMLRLGLFIYDHLAKRTLLPASYAVNLRQHEVGAALKESLQRGFIYADAWVDDARLVVANALDAAEKGARVFTHTECVAIKQQDGFWQADLLDRRQVSWRSEPQQIQVQARCLVNASGSWAAQVQALSAAGQAERHSPPQATQHLRLIKGSHIIVPRLFNHAYAYIFQNNDGRIVFAIPYESDFTLIGTTDINYKGDINAVHISAGEIDYLCELANHFFKQPISATDIVHSYAGVRPLVDDGATEAKAITRDYHLQLNQDGAPQLHVFGGKITTYRKLAEEAVNLLTPLLRNYHNAWTEHALLPGGDLCAEQGNQQAVLPLGAFVRNMQAHYPWLPAKLAQRYACSYGSRMRQLLLLCDSCTDLGEEIAPGLYAREVQYLMQHEWASCAEDILWRRSKLGLHLPPDTEQKLDTWIRLHS